MAYDQKKQAGRGPMQKTGAGVPSALLQSTDEKKGEPKIITKKNPNLSDPERNLISDGNMSEKRWQGLLKDRTMENFEPKRLALVKAQKDRDSAYIVDNRVTRKNAYTTSSMSFVKPEDQKSRQGKYRTNYFKRGRDGNVVVRGEFDNHNFSNNY